MSERIPQEVALAAAQRLIANAFGEREAKLSIPAEEDDDDLIVVKYIQQQRAPTEADMGGLIMRFALDDFTTDQVERFIGCLTEMGWAPVEVSP